MIKFGYVYETVQFDISLYVCQLLKKMEKQFSKDGLLRNGNRKIGQPLAKT